MPGKVTTTWGDDRGTRQWHQEEDHASLIHHALTSHAKKSSTGLNKVREHPPAGSADAVQTLLLVRSGLHVCSPPPFGSGVVLKKGPLSHSVQQHVVIAACVVKPRTH